MLATNLNGFFYIIQRAVEVMSRQGNGHIVQIATMLVEHANSKVSSVQTSLSKGGLAAATRSLAIEYAAGRFVRMRWPMCHQDSAPRV